MADSLRYIDWYKKSQTDLSGAKILLEYGGDYSLVAFHAQQAIEKALKGYILKETNTLMEGHSLIYLINNAIKFDPNIRNFKRDCAYINQFYVETRYPADIIEEISQDEAIKAIDISKNILKYIIK